MLGQVFAINICHMALVTTPQAMLCHTACNVTWIKGEFAIDTMRNMLQKFYPSSFDKISMPVEIAMIASASYIVA